MNTLKRLNDRDVTPLCVRICQSHLHGMAYNFQNGTMTFILLPFISIFIDSYNCTLCYSSMDCENIVCLNNNLKKIIKFFFFKGIRRKNNNYNNNGFFFYKIRCLSKQLV